MKLFFGKDRGLGVGVGEFGFRFRFVVSVSEMWIAEVGFTGWVGVNGLFV